MDHPNQNSEENDRFAFMQVRRATIQSDYEDRVSKGK